MKTKIAIDLYDFYTVEKNQLILDGCDKNLKCYLYAISVQYNLSCDY